MNSDISIVLKILAENYVGEGAHEKAILCLEGLCHSGRGGPGTRAQAHLRLSKLLLEKTINVHEAKEHALKSVFLHNLN